MNLYSHLVWAQEIEPDFELEDHNEFFWGSVAPDIRYLTGMRRVQTHLSRDQVTALYAQYPELNAFLLGYSVHLLIDEIDLTKIVCARLPLRLLRSQFSPRKLAMLVELYFQEKKQFRFQIQPTNNAFLADLGIDPLSIESYARALNQYYACPSLQSMIEISEAFGMFADTRVQQYLRSAGLFTRYPLVKRLLFSAVRAAKIDDVAIAYVRSALTEINS